MEGEGRGAEGRGGGENNRGEGKKGQDRTGEISNIKLTNHTDLRRVWEEERRRERRSYRGSMEVTLHG